MPGQWFYRKGVGEKRGPFTAEELKRFAATGELLPDDKVWKEGKRKWVSAHKVERLFDSPAAAAVATVPRKPAAEPVPLPDAAVVERAWLSCLAGRSSPTPPAQALAALARLTEERVLADAAPTSCNALLAEIARTLNDLGFTADGPLDWLARQETLHADYYESLRRQKSMKELLDQIGRFQAMAESLYDVFARGYGARLMVETLERHRFAPRALADLSDREVFNKQLAWAGDAYHRLPAAAHADIDNFKRAYRIYHWLKDADPERALRAAKNDIDAAPKPTVSPPAVPSRGLGSFAILLVTTLVWTALLVMVCVVSVAENDPPPGGYVGFMCALDGFPVTVTLAVFLLAYRRYRRAMVQYAADRQAYQAARSQALKESREARSRVQTHNDAIDKLIPEVRRDHAAALAALREALNGFVGAHPQLVTFVSPV